MDQLVVILLEVVLGAHEILELVEMAVRLLRERTPDPLEADHAAVVQARENLHNGVEVGQLGAFLEGSGMNRKEVEWNPCLPSR